MRCGRDAPRLLIWHPVISASHIVSVEVDGGRGGMAWLKLLVTEPRESEIKRWERSSAQANNITVWHAAKLTHGSWGAWVTLARAAGSRSDFQPALVDVGDVKPPLGLKISLLIAHSPNDWESAFAFNQHAALILQVLRAAQDQSVSLWVGKQKLVYNSLISIHHQEPLSGNKNLACFGEEFTAFTAVWKESVECAVF